MPCLYLARKMLNIAFILLIIITMIDTIVDIAYKNTIYDKKEKSTHINWVDLSKAFTKDLEFFKGMANLFSAYSCHPGIFPIYPGFKIQENFCKALLFLYSP